MPPFFSDDASSSHAGSQRSSFQREPGHLTPSHFARSSSLGGHTRASTAASSTGQSNSAGQESGFQSCTSLVSLSQQKHSLFRGSPLPLHQRLQQDMERAESSLSGSMASLASGVIVPSLVNGMMRHSLNSGTPSSRPESRLQLNQNRRSARSIVQVQEKQPLIDPREHFSPVNQPHWVLKPLFFEVPQRDPNPIFVGRQWLYGEVVEHLASNLPTNRGLVISGGPGTGKTSLLLKLVEMSCFGRGEPIYQGMKNRILIRFRVSL